MNKKGETDIGIGMIIVVAMVAIIGAVFLQAIAQQVGDVTNTIDVANDSISNVNGTTLANLLQLSGKFVSGVVVYNATSDYLIGSGNYTIYNNQVINGAETAGINVSTEVAGGIDDGDWQISYTYQPTTYDANSGGRAVARIIVIFFALAIAVAMLIPTMRSKILDSVSR